MKTMKQLVVETIKETSAAISAGEEHQPTVFFVSPDGEITTLPLARFPVKDTWYSVVRSALAILAPAFYIFVDEAYMTVMAPEDAGLPLPSPIKDMPGRMEVLMVQVTDPDGSTELHTKEITEANGARTLAQWGVGAGAQVLVLPTTW